jgi:hypothetical protein
VAVSSHTRQIGNTLWFELFSPFLVAPAFGAEGWISSVSWSETVGRTPWTGDQLVARPLPVHKHRKTHTHTQTLNIHAPSAIWTFGPGFWASEDSARLRPLGYHDRLVLFNYSLFLCLIRNTFLIWTNYGTGSTTALHPDSLLWCKCIV